jgi:uncharacterized protein
MRPLNPGPSSGGVVLLLAAFLTTAAAGQGATRQVSALEHAIDANDLQLVTRLLAAGADPDAIDNSALTPLVHAVIDGNPAMVSTLLKSGATPNLPGVAWSPLEAAFATRAPQQSQRAAPAQSPSRRQSPPKAYRLACNMPIVNLLLANGADPNGEFPDVGERPLQAALERGDLACVNVLLDHGADPWSSSVRGKSALAAAIDGASNTGQPELVDRIMSLGVDVNGGPGKRGSPIATATAHGNVAVARMLLKRGADPCVTDAELNAWDIALGDGRKDRIDLLEPYHCSR